ncbi:MAG: hypothetical protein R3F59_20575 [Myxococcota bacterium]
MTPDLAAAERLRDAFFALPPGDPSAAARLRADLEGAEPHVALAVEGLSVSFHPTARHHQVSFVDEALVDAPWRGRFARPSGDAPHLLAAFVDPRELSLRTYENIVPLDRLFEGEPLDLALADRARLGDDRDVHAYTFALQASDAARAALSRLDALDLYATPRNAASRGGQRYVFHAAPLAEALTAAVRQALPKALAKGFSHVNPVFRCNRFEPGDADFHAHVDTPYRDAARGHASRYTLLVYLTGGRAAPALRIEDAVAVEAIAPFTCVLFHQRHEHAGAAFVDGRKVFLRTELVFEEPAVEEAPDIAALFAKACWYEGESLFAPELAREAADAFDRVAAAHWQGLAAGPAAEAFVHKRFRGVHYLANGYDFWFPRGALPLEACAAVTLLDVLNAKVGGTPFRALCTAETVRVSGPDELEARLAPHAAPPAEAPFAPLNKDALFPAPEAVDDRLCCPFHCFPGFEAVRCAEIVDLFARTQRFARRRIDPAPVLAMGQEIFLDPSRFRVGPGRIDVLGPQPLAPVNFAACWNAGGSPDNYVDVDLTLEAHHLLVPPILYRQTERSVHLMFDLFRNGWMVRHEAVEVPVPRIGVLGPEEAEETGATPWFDAVPPAAVRPAADADLPWWGDGALVAELFGQGERR